MTAFWLIIVYLAALYLQVGVKFPALAPLRPLILLAALVLASGILYMAQRRGRRTIFDGQIKLMVWILGFIGVSLLFAYIRVSALDKWIDFAKMVIMAFFLVNVVDSLRKTKWLLYALLLLHVPVAIEGLQGFYTVTVREEAQTLRGTLSSFLGNSNDFALAMTVILPYAYFLMLAVRSRVVQVFLAACCVLFGLTVMFTFSRGGFLTLIVLFAHAALRSSKRLSVAAIGGVLVIASLMVLPATYWQRIETIGEAGSEWNTQTRLWAWQAGLSMAIHNPVLGMGPGNFVTAYRKFYRPSEATTRATFTAHSIYFQVMGELGFVGLGLFGWFVVSTFRAQNALLRDLRIQGLDTAGDGVFVKVACHAMQASLIAFLAGGAFLSAAYYPHLWLNGTLTQVLVTTARERLLRPFAPNRPAVSRPYAHRTL